MAQSDKKSEAELHESALAAPEIDESKFPYGYGDERGGSAHSVRTVSAAGIPEERDK